MTETIDTAQPEALRLADLLNRVRVGDSWRSIGGTIAKSAVELRRLHAALAAAEARNATLTDDAARYRWLRDAKSLELTSDGMEWTRADGTKFCASHRLCAGQTAFAAYPSLDETIDAARAAASISTKGDGP